jgi:replicative DNA helicase Mcm
METTEQIKRFVKFLERNYHAELLDQIRKGEKFLNADYGKFAVFDPDLADALLDHPDDILKVGEMAIEEFDVEGDVKGFTIRFSNLPESQKIMLRNIRSHHIGKFMTTLGVVRQKSDVRPQVTSSRFECPSCGNIIPVLQLDNKLKEPTRCGCGRKGKFRLLSKEMVDAQGLVLEEAPEELDGGEQPKRMNVFLKNDLVSPMSEKKTNPGSKIMLTGIIKEVPIILKSGGQSTRFDLLVEANYIETLQEEYGDIDISDEEMDEIKKLGEDPKVYTKLMNSAAPGIYGYGEIKEALIYQMMGGVRKIREEGEGSVTRGDIHVLLCGDPGAGKCLKGNTRIILDNGDTTTIKSLVENTQIFEKPEVFSINEKGLNFSSQPVRFWKRKSPKHLLKIKTSTGSELYLTKDHPLFTTKHGFIFAKEANQFKNNDFIALPSKINVTGQYQNIPYKIRKSMANNKVKYKLKYFLDEEFARFLGYLVGDGYVRFTKTSGTIRFTNSDKDLLDDYEYLVKKIFGLQVKKRAKQGTTALEYMISSIDLVRILSKIDSNLIKTSANMNTCSLIKKSPNSIVKEFIKALFDCESHVAKGRREIEFSSKSKELAEDVRYLLLRFGIISQLSSGIKYAANTTKKIRRTYYRLRVSGEDIKRYAKQIGFVSKFKNYELQKRVRSKKSYNTNLKVVPHVNDLLKLLRRKYNLTQFSFPISRTTYQHYERGDRFPSSHRLKLILHKYKSLGVKDPLIEILNQICNAEIFWDRILSIEKVESDEEFVYDLEIDHVHNFVASGVVVHNSQLLKRIQKVAPKARYVAGKGVSGAGLTAAVVKDEFLQGWSLEAGALVLANKGQIMIDELDKMSSEDRSAMHEALEQQCYHYNFELMLADGSTQKIGEFVDGLMENHNDKIIEGKECQILKTNDLPEVLTTDFQNIQPIQIDRVSRHIATDHFIKITYSNGRSITVTPEHPVFIENNGRIETIRADKVRHNLLAPAPRKLPTKELNFEGENIVEKGLFHGLHCSEGYSYKNEKYRLTEIGISNTDKKIISLAKNCIQSVFNQKPNIQIQKAQSRKKATKDLITVRMGSRSAYQLLQQQTPEVLHKTPLKRVPQIVKTGELLLKLTFLQGYFLGDGFVDQERVGFVTSSKLMAQDLQQLLLNLDIYSYIDVEKRHTKNYHKIVVSGSDGLELFCQLIPCIDARKKRVETLVKRSKKKNNDRDIMPVSLIRKLRYLLQMFRLDTGYFYHHLKKNQNAHRNTCLYFLKKIEERVEKGDEIMLSNDPCKMRKHWCISLKSICNMMGISVQSVSNYENLQNRNHAKLIACVKSAVKKKREKSLNIIKDLHSIIRGHIRFVKVTKVETIPNLDQKWTYDVTIEPNHTFISQNLVLHNTVSISKANIQATLRSETTVLAAANPKFGRFDPYQTVAEQIDLPPTLINRFDLIFPIKDLPDPTKDEHMAAFILNLHQNPDIQEADVDTSFLRKYIAYAKQHIHPQLTDSAIKEIKDYYLKMRASGSTESGIKSIPISARQLEGLVRLSEAVARTRLSDKISKKDAKRAINLLNFCLRQIAFDEETGTIDIDRIATEMPASQRGKIVSIREIIIELENKLGKTVPIEEVISAAREKGLSEEEVDEAIEKLKRTGNIFEPRPGIISRI